MRFFIALLALVPLLASAADVAKFPAISLNAQTNVLSANATNLTFTGGYTALSNSSKAFSVGYPSGDLSIIKSVPYSWPTANAVGSLQNDGSGGLTWTTTGASLWSSNAPMSGGWGGTGIASLDTNLIATIKGGLGFYDPNVTGIDGTTNDYYFVIVPGSSDAGNPDGGGVGIFATGRPEVYTPTNCCVGSTYQDSIRVQLPLAQSLPPHLSYAALVATRSDYPSPSQDYPRTNDVLYGISADGYVPFLISVVSDGYDPQPDPFDGVPVGGFGRFGINTNTPTATFEVATHYSDKPMAKFSHTDGTVPALIGYDGLLTSFGISSTATDAAVSISSTGWTNSFGKSAEVWFRGTNVTYTIANNAGTLIRTNLTTTGVDTLQFILQTGGKMVVTSGTVVGSATPF